MRFDLATKQRYFYTFAVAWVIYRFWGYSLFSQIGIAPLKCPEVDNTFWLFHLSKLPDLVTQSTAIAAILDITLFLIPLLLLKQFNRAAAIGFSILLVVYHLTFATYSCHHFHSLMGLMLMSIPWWIKKGTNKQLVIEGVRYYFLFAMVSAALWKISRGGVFEPTQMVGILKSQHAQYLFDFPTSYFSEMYSYFINHPSLSYFLLLFGTALEFFFIIGFFTKKADKILAVTFMTFLFFNFLIMGIFSFELLPFILALEWNKNE